jgi:LCP family protein required for cell wall assembly
MGLDSEAEPRRTDTIIAARLDLSAKRVGVVSVPRDLRVSIPGHSEQKVNSAYSLGGVALARQTIEGLLGVGSDYYVKLDSRGLAKLVDALGGVEINVDKRMYYRDRSQHLYIDLQPGVQRLNGQQAVGYVRFRHDRTGDFMRMARQQAFMRAVLREVWQPRNLRRIPKLLRLFGETVETDLTFRDLQAMSDFLKQVNPARVKAATLVGTPLDLHGVSYLEADPQQVAAVVNQVLLNVQPRVAIVNATGVPGVEQELVKRLTGEGYQVSEVRFSSHTSAISEVMDGGAQPDSAKEIRGWLKCGIIVRPNHDAVPGADITVVLATDYVNQG